MKRTEKVTQAGIYNIDIDLYHADKSWISSTGIKHAKNSLCEYRLYLDGYWDDDNKPHFDFGNAVELFLIDPDGFKEKVAIATDSVWLEATLKEKPDLKSPRLAKAYQELKKAFEADNEGRYIIPDVGEYSFETLQILCARCKADPWISQLLQNIQYQNSIYWIDPATGLQMKTRPDVSQITKSVVMNIKTTLDASPDKFSKDLANLNYPLQACVEIAGVEASGLMEKVDKYFWLVLEKNPPFNVQLYEFDAGDMRIAMDEYHYLLRKIKAAVETDNYPGYSDRADNPFGILTAKIPPWYFMAGN